MIKSIKLASGSEMPVLGLGTAKVLLKLYTNRINCH